MLWSAAHHSHHGLSCAAPGHNTGFAIPRPTTPPSFKKRTPASHDRNHHLGHMGNSFCFPSHLVSPRLISSHLILCHAIPCRIMPCRARHPNWFPGFSSRRKTHVTTKYGPSSYYRAPLIPRHLNINDLLPRQTSSANPDSVEFANWQLVERFGVTKQGEKDAKPYLPQTQIIPTQSSSSNSSSSNPTRSGRSRCGTKRRAVNSASS